MVSVNTKAQLKECPLCATTFSSEKSKCPSCGRWVFSAGAANDAGAYDIRNDGSVLLEDIDEAAIERVDVGPLNDCLDGGLVRSDVVLIGGGPGAGKSTLMLQVAEILCKHGLVMYISAEEDVKAIKLRAKRLGTKSNRKIRMLPALSGVSNIGAMLWAHRPKFIIADSLDALSARNADEEIVILTILKKFCVELQAPAIVISQVNKGGDYSGLKAKQHAVDVLLTFDADETEKVGDDFLRVMNTVKNRSGRAATEAFFAMTGTGLQQIEWPPDSEDSDDLEDDE